MCAYFYFHVTFHHANPLIKLPKQLKLSIGWNNLTPKVDLLDLPFLKPLDLSHPTIAVRVHTISHHILQWILEYPLPPPLARQKTCGCHF